MTVTDPISHTNLNPNHDWFFRSQHAIDPSAHGCLIGYIIVGKLPNEVSDTTLEGLLKQIPLPKRNTSPPESCVTWALEALVACQRQRWAWHFDIAEFKDWALGYGDECMKRLDETNICVNRV